MRKGYLVWVGILLLGAVVWGVRQAGRAKGKGLTPDEMVQEVRAHNTQWWRQIPGQGEWLLVVSLWENPFAQGQEPDTGWPIFRRYRESLWFHFTSNGTIDAVVGQSEHLDGPHAYRIAWKPGFFVREPALMAADQAAPGTWPEHPILDACAAVLEATWHENKEQAEVAFTAEASRARVAVVHPIPPTDILPVAQKVVAEEVACAWDGPTTLIQEQRYWTETGEKVLYLRRQIVEARWVAQPPQGLLALLAGETR